MISGRQIRAARALLDWDAEDLAERAKLSRDTVFNIEKGTVQARGGSMDKIVQAFASSGVEFTDDGVRVKPTGVEIYEGTEKFDGFYDFLYEHLKNNGGDVCCSIYDESLAAKYRKNPEIHRKRMKELVEKGSVTFRVLTTKSDFASQGYAQIQWQPQQYATLTGFYAFGDCLALMSFVNESSPYVVVIQSAPLAEGYRQGFNVAWENASRLPFQAGDKP